MGTDSFRWLDRLLLGDVVFQIQKSECLEEKDWRTACGQFPNGDSVFRLDSNRLKITDD
jgi:hypothetical protein